MGSIGVIAGNSRDYTQDSLMILQGFLLDKTHTLLRARCWHEYSCAL